MQRSEVIPVIYDYRDEKVAYLDRMFLKRNVYYKKLERQRSLFDFPVCDENAVARSEMSEQIIEKRIKVKIDDLEFLYGGLRFIWRISELTDELILEVENLNTRQEFEVLKSYFEKMLKASFAEVHIVVILDGKGQLSALSAESDTLSQIDRVIIEGVHFQFTEQFLRGKG